MTKRHPVAITLAVGFALITALLIGTLVQTPDEIIATNTTALATEVGLFSRPSTICQANERIPASTTALRVSLVAYIGPAVSVTVSHGGHLLATGHHDAGWVSGSLTLPLKPPVASPTDATICVTGASAALPVAIFGDGTPRDSAATINGELLPGRMRIEYLAPGHRSWLSLATDIARRLGLGHAPSGTWIVLPLAAMMALAVALGAWLLMREQRYE